MPSKVDSSFILKTYQDLRRSTEENWAKHPTEGKLIGLPSGYFNIGVSMGSLFKPMEKLGLFIERLHSLSAEDDSLVIVPKECQHFTFLALASHKWVDIDELPLEVRFLKSLCQEFFHDLKWNLNDLQLVPGNNYLLLGGVPTTEIILQREKFAASLLNSPWESQIRNRHEYKGYPFPPVIWHTTLCRSKTEFLPQTVRDLYEVWKNENFGLMNLPAPQLRAINYDWTFNELLI